MLSADRRRLRAHRSGTSRVPWFRVPLLLLSLAVSLGACRSSSAPRVYRDSPAGLASRVSGSWVEVRRLDGQYRYGELLATAGDTLFAIHLDTLHAIPRDSVARVELTRYRPSTGQLALWTTLGVISTASHGFYLVLTAPTWVITGIAAAAAESRRAIWHTTDFAKLAPWSRFPAGLPSLIDRRQLREAPPHLPAR